MRLNDLIAGLEILQGKYDNNIEIDNIVYDSRKARQGSLFVCIEGYVTDGHKYIEQALDQGVSAIVIQKQTQQLTAAQVSALSKVHWLRIPDTRRGLAIISDRFFDHPSGRLDLIGITGTKGKTTTTFMARSIMELAGRNTGLVGTIANMIGSKTVHASRTTPESYDLQSLLNEMIVAGMDSCVMEVSSQGLKLDRVYGCDFKIGVFTNLFEDHIGPHEHADMEEYLAAKLLLLQRSEFNIINADSEYFDRARGAAGGKIITYGFAKTADVRAANLRRSVKSGRVGTYFTLESPWYNMDVFVGMPGRFNVSNALAAIAVCGCLGLSLENILAGLEKITVPGRVQTVPSDHEFQVIVDYAHNAASLEHLLLTLREYTDRRLIVVFGNGGDRAKSRRFEMGAVSGHLADLTIITSDNPRTEDPMSIIADIITGIKPTGGIYEVVPDRREAINRAIESACTGDMVIIAGKGHETYQIFSDRTIHFDDAETAAELLAMRAKS
jgi:UDP-N-acetylmuramoyl-L-alanyl-D-glutamate--2,6-diaminopimelate ligase